MAKGSSLPIFVQAWNDQKSYTKYMNTKTLFAIYSIVQEEYIVLMWWILIFLWPNPKTTTSGRKVTWSKQNKNQVAGDRATVSNVHRHRVQGSSSLKLNLLGWWARCRGYSYHPIILHSSSILIKFARLRICLYRTKLEYNLKKYIRSTYIYVGHMLTLVNHVIYQKCLQYIYQCQSFL
jgi:hypothetical protein